MTCPTLYRLHGLERFGMLQTGADSALHRPRDSPTHPGVTVSENF
jgi:hypothetical protein